MIINADLKKSEKGFKKGRSRKEIKATNESSGSSRSSGSSSDVSRDFFPEYTLNTPTKKQQSDDDTHFGSTVPYLIFLFQS
jgi:hypothetical protein